MKNLLVAGAIVLATFSAQAAVSTSTYNVDAQANSVNGGTGLSTITLSAGESFSVLASASDLWSAGALPRWSNANGLTSSLAATGSDESGLASGTLIGQSFGAYTYNGFTAAFGQLVGQVGSQYFALGTNAVGTATSAGTLNLFYWDNLGSDNVGSIAVTVAVASVPEPETFAMLLAGLGLIGAMVRRRTK